MSKISLTKQAQSNNKKNRICKCRSLRKYILGMHSAAIDRADTAKALISCLI